MHSEYVTRGGLLKPSPNKIDFGRVGYGSSKERGFQLTNSTGSAVEVSEIWSSCPCLKASLSSQIVGPTEIVSGRLELQLNREMDFKGYLEIEIEGRCPNGELAFALTAPVKIVEAE